MSWWHYFIVIIYGLCLSFVFFYSVSQFLLFLKAYSLTKPTNPAKKLSHFPKVCIQLPIYNEGEIVERLLKNIAQINYPTEALEIQVLDDSTDDSLEKNQALVKQLQQDGIPIQHFHRKKRTAFKAGALKEGLQHTEAEFIAVFDADFMPKANWLQQTLGCFEDPEVGVVQTRWGHLNKNYSLITQVQALALDFHFCIEQVGRNRGNHLINFNGTAGIWRKSCILDAGNWRGDTLTEDLDLSYRAQLKHWKIHYLNHVSTPAELPIEMNAARSQQFRWNKGAAENFRLNYAKVRKAAHLPISTKIHAFFHLLNSSLFFVILTLAVLSFPVLFIKHEFPSSISFFYGFTILGLSTFLYMIGYAYTYFKENKFSLKSVLQFVFKFFSFFALAMGLSVSNSKAILEGHLGKKSSFIRTPKFNVLGKQKAKVKKGVPQRFKLINLIELGLLFYFILALVYAFQAQDFALFPFHLMLVFGFGFVTWSTWQSRFFRLNQ